MLTRPSPILKVFSGALCLVFLFTNCLFAHAPEINFWAERRKAVQRKDPPFQLANLPSALPLINSKFEIRNSSIIFDHRNGTKQFHVSDLPLQYGTVRKVLAATGKQAGIVIHIQDVHLNS